MPLTCLRGTALLAPCDHCYHAPASAARGGLTHPQPLQPMKPHPLRSGGTPGVRAADRLGSLCGRACEPDKVQFRAPVRESRLPRPCRTCRRAVAACAAPRGRGGVAVARAGRRGPCSLRTLWAEQRDVSRYEVGRTVFEVVGDDDAGSADDRRGHHVLIVRVWEQPAWRAHGVEGTRPCRAHVNRTMNNLPHRHDGPAVRVRFLPAFRPDSPAAEGDRRARLTTRVRRDGCGAEQRADQAP